MTMMPTSSEVRPSVECGVNNIAVPKQSFHSLEKRYDECDHQFGQSISNRYPQRKEYHVHCVVEFSIVVVIPNVSYPRVNDVSNGV